MSFAKHLRGPFVGALAHQTRRQILGEKVVRVARSGDGLAAEGEHAQRANLVAGISSCA